MNAYEKSWKLNEFLMKTYYYIVIKYCKKNI